MSKWDRKDLSVNDYLYNAYKYGFIEDPTGTKHKLIDVTSPEEGRLIYDIVRKNKYTKTLEIGLAMGASAVWICQAHKDNGIKGLHTAIDPNQSTQYKNLGLLMVKNSGLINYFDIIENLSYFVLPTILEDVQKGKTSKFDFIYIDGWHTFDYTLIDFFYSDQLLNIGGTIVIDDVRHAGVKKCVSYILQNYKHYKVIENKLETNIILAKVGEDNREWFFHKNF